MYESRSGHYEHKYDWNFVYGFGDVSKKEAHKHTNYKNFSYEIIAFFVYLIGVLAFVAFYFFGG